MSASSPDLGVIIAARDAAATIGSAVASALADPLVGEVVVVDDGSTDGTAAAAVSAAAGDSRFLVLMNPTSLGPAAARNRALEQMRASAIAILDADDRFLPGRSARLAAARDWDLVADNIVFVADPEAPLPPLLLDLPEHFETVLPSTFIAGNGASGLLYDPALRLGEDYDLYVRALLAGARFLLTRRPGYVAVVRGESLSSRHTTADLAALAAAARRHLSVATHDPALEASMRRLLRQLETRHAHRALLDRKRQVGTLKAVTELLGRPDLAPAVAHLILRDKLAAGAEPPVLPRLLLPEGKSD